MNKMTKHFKNTIDLMMMYNFKTPNNPVNYSNAVYRDNLIDIKSTYAHTILFENEIITWSNKKQRFTVILTTKIELIAMCQTSKNIV